MLSPGSDGRHLPLPGVSHTTANGQALQSASSFAPSSAALFCVGARVEQPARGQNIPEVLNRVCGEALEEEAAIRRMEQQTIDHDLKGQSICQLLLYRLRNRCNMRRTELQTGNYCFDPKSRVGSLTTRIAIACLRSAWRLLSTMLYPVRPSCDPHCELQRWNV